MYPREQEVSLKIKRHQYHKRKNGYVLKLTYYLQGSLVKRERSKYFK